MVGLSVASAAVAADSADAPLDSGAVGYFAEIVPVVDWIGFHDVADAAT